MPSIRHSVIGEETLLAAARDCILAVGLRRTTMTDVARRAGVSRMTVYRRWPDMTALVADLMTQELTAGDMRFAPPDGHLTPAVIAREVADRVVRFRDNPLFRKIVEVDPELLLPYLLVRRGRTQDELLGDLREAIALGQRAGHLRAGAPEVLARSVLLTTHGFVLSAHTMDDLAEGDEDDGIRRLLDELVAMLTAYLAPPTPAATR